MAKDDSDIVEVGKIARPHGVRGELRVTLHDPGDGELLCGVERLFLAGRAHTVDHARQVQGAVLIRLAGVADRNAADVLRGQPVGLARDDLGLAEGEVLLSDLVGCQVVLEGGEAWGEITAVETGVQDRLVIRHGAVERELPLVDAFVLDIDLDAGRVVVAPPEDLPEWPART